jgi:hypothetical protein
MGKTGSEPWDARDYFCDTVFALYLLRETAWSLVGSWTVGRRNRPEPSGSLEGRAVIAVTRPTTLSWLKPELLVRDTVGYGEAHTVGIDDG